MPHLCDHVGRRRRRRRWPHTLSPSLGNIPLPPPPASASVRQGRYHFMSEGGGGKGLSSARPGCSDQLCEKSRVERSACSISFRDISQARLPALSPHPIHNPWQTNPRPLDVLFRKWLRPYFSPSARPHAPARPHPSFPAFPPPRSLHGRRGEKGSRQLLKASSEVGNIVGGRLRELVGGRGDFHKFTERNRVL